MEAKSMWVARDKDGRIFIYDSKPYKTKDIFRSDNDYWSCIPKHMYPEVTFENSPKELITKQD